MAVFSRKEGGFSGLRKLFSRFFCPTINFQFAVAFTLPSLLFALSSSAVGTGPGGLGGMMTPFNDFGRSVNPIPTRGADFAHLLLLPPPIFFTFKHQLYVEKKVNDSYFVQ